MIDWVMALLAGVFGYIILRLAFVDPAGRWLMGIVGVALIGGAAAWMVWRIKRRRAAKLAPKEDRAGPATAKAALVPPTTPRVVQRPENSQASSPIVLPPNNYEGARAVMRAQDSEEGWDFPDDVKRAFLWVDLGDEQSYIAESWNRRFPPAAPVDHAFLGDGMEGELADTQTYTWRGGRVQWDIVEGREDSIIAVWALALLTQNELGIRFCRDTYGSTQPAYAVLTNSDWKRLEAEFGAEAVRMRFRALPPGQTAETIWGTWLGA